MERLRVGVLGCASIARRKMLPALTACPRTRVTAVASRSGERAKEFAAEFGTVPVAGYQELLDRPDVDAVYLPLPAGLRAEWILRALAAGKHVLAEKPLTTRPALAREAVELSRRRGLLLMENFMFLHHSAHRRVRELVGAGRIGEPRSFSAEFTIPALPADDIRHRPELGGGALLDLGAYPVRAAQLFCGPDLAVAGAVLHHDPGTGVDVAGAALLASAGMTATLSFGMAHHYRCRYALTGSEGTLTLDRAFTPPPDHRPLLRLERPEGTQELLLRADDQFANVVDAFARTALAGRGFDGPGDRILRQADLLERVRLAATPAPTAG
ncbi:Gfo/Idh/MocA family protein [Kitasatospora sp. NPDC101801]|uniref:Gfo/Idh/MocA family protein n=1 Tax=Kitasatospora sp. NPDC101801 TaxID=3364103 RepID=UPI0038015AA7